MYSGSRNKIATSYTGLATFGIANVFGIEVNAQLIGSSEVRSICAGTAADVENAANALHVVVGRNGNKFPFGKSAVRRR
jgi:hypothetical protein